MMMEMVDPPPAYHNGNCSAPDRNSSGRLAPPPVESRKVIAWDMEGMNLSGDDKPQHPVLFGNSIDTDNPLIAKRLKSFDMLNYIVDTGKANPFALHVGYGFKYDVNMMLQDLPTNAFVKLWRANHIKFRWNSWWWTIQYIPGKKYTVTRARLQKSKHDKERTTVCIYDYSSFFGGKAFLQTVEDILGKDVSDVDRKTIEHGKTDRGGNQWKDLANVRYYWQREIVLIERVFRRFRDVMVRAAFPLKEWYGPGALANFINARHAIRSHIGAAQVTSGVMPTAVHEASKIAFSGGRFEAFKLGRVKGPIYCIDINSAYPYGLTMIPSLAPENGQWRHENTPTTIRRFGFYRVTFKADNAKSVDFRPMPLFWRNKHGLISYPNRLEGWYASPEARMVAGMPGMQINEGWIFDCDESVRPWSFLPEMYATRQRLGKGNLLSLPFKLGPNSLYGKYAQTVGWNEKDKLPPKSHCLPVAAWVTSFCRSQLWPIINRLGDSVIAVETDSIFTTTDPRTLGIPIGDELGEWSIKAYDEIVYLQSGMYLTKKDGEWQGVRSRGITRGEFPVNGTLDFVRGLRPGSDWGTLDVTTKPRFIGMGAALASGQSFKSEHCVWRPQHKQISFGDSGKRRHNQSACEQCANGVSPWDAAHSTFIASESDGLTMSHPRRLPWERKHTDEVTEIRDMQKLEQELILR